MAKKEEILAKGCSKFELCGKVKVTDKTFKIDEQSKNNKDYIYNQLNLSIDCGKEDSNIIYAQMMGGYDKKKQYPIRVFGKKKNENDFEVTDYQDKFEIPFNERKTSRLLPMVGNDCFINIGLERDENDKCIVYKFLHEYDAIQFLKDNLQDGMIVFVKGLIKHSIYKGETQVTKNIKSIYISKAEKKDFKAEFEQTCIFTKDSINFKDIDEDGLLTMYPYVVDYSQITKSNVCYSLPLNLDTIKFPRYETICKKYFLPTKKNMANSVLLEGSWVATSNLVDIKFEDLSVELQEMVELGMFSEEEAYKKQKAIGDKPRKQLTMYKNLKVVEGKTFIDENKYDIEDLIFEDDIKEDEAPFDAEETKSYSKTTQNIKTKTEDVSQEIDEDDLFSDDDLFADLM